MEFCRILSIHSRLSLCMVISKISPEIIMAEIVFLESLAFQFHARMLSSKVAQSLKSYRHFSDLGVGIAMLYVSGKANTSIHVLGGDDTARPLTLARNEKVAG